MIALERRYHVPRSQVWQGSRGRQEGRVHLHLPPDAGPWGVPIPLVGRIARTPGSSLCGRCGWYERAPEFAYERTDEALCARCVAIAARLEGVSMDGASGAFVLHRTEAGGLILNPREAER
jgi:hypothetical protein